MDENIPLKDLEKRKRRKEKKKLETQLGEEKVERRKRRTKKRPRENPDSLNNSFASSTAGKLESDNGERIVNDISSESKTRNKNVNPAKEERRKLRERREQRLKEKKDDENGEEEETIKKVENVIGVFIHECQPLKMDFLISHPVVKVSLVDGESGQLLEKSDPNRKVTSYYEDEKVFRILPLMTQPFDFRIRRDILPKWEELLLFNDDFEVVFEQNKNVIMFFEVIDFVSMAVAGENYRKHKQKGGWYRIAWGFLKIRENEWKTQRFGERVRLQLFKPSIVSEEKENIVDVWRLWKSNKRREYPSSLWVTVEPVVPPTSSQPTLRSMVPTQPELGFQMSGELAEINSCAPEENKIVNWSRLPGQSCKIPNTLSVELESGGRGCSTLAFSCDGRQLAAGINNQTSSHIRIYDIPSGVLVTELAELYGLVYQISFHKDGFMTAAVGDGIVPVWDSTTWELVAKLNHPSYVYSAVFFPSSSKLIATAGFDRVIRIWRRDNQSKKETVYSVVQELSGHNSHINCLTFDTEGHFLFSGDKTGMIKMWESPENHLGFESSTDSYARPNIHREWSYKREYNVEDHVCKLSIHPGGRRLLVHRLNPTAPLIMLDLRNGSYMQNYPDIQTFRVPAASCITPCGSWVLGGSDSGYAVIWNTDTGIKQHVYNSLPYDGSVSALAFHPLDHCFVVAGSQPYDKMFVFTYDKSKDKSTAEENQVLSTPRPDSNTAKYPFKEVARLIVDGSEKKEEFKSAVDLQDIVEKLNHALRVCRQTNPDYPADKQ